MHIITIASGKGGVGKTNIAVNIAIMLSRKGYKTCLFDADLGLANVNILMGIVTEQTLVDVIEDSVPLRDIIIKNWNGIDIIPGSSGMEKMESLSSEDLDKVLAQFSAIDNYDYFICDTAAGISQNVLAFCMAASQVLVPILPEPTSLTDSYSLLKVLTQKGFEQSPAMIVNRSKSAEFGEKLYEKFKKTTEKFLPIKLSYCGSIPEDPQITDSVAKQIPFVINAPDTPATRGIIALVDSIEALSGTIRKPMPGRFFEAFGRILKKNNSIRTRPAKDEAPRELPDTQADAGSPVSDKAFQTMIVSTLQTLTDNTAMMISELSRIRELLDNRGQGRSETAPAPITGPEDGAAASNDNNPPVLSLNFEQYVRDKKQSQ